MLHWLKLYIIFILHPIHTYIHTPTAVSISFNRTVVSLSEDSKSFSVDIVRTGVTAIVLEIDLDVSSDSSATIGMYMP